MAAPADFPEAGESTAAPPPSPALFRTVRCVMPTIATSATEMPTGYTSWSNSSSGSWGETPGLVGDSGVVASELAKRSCMP